MKQEYLAAYLPHKVKMKTRRDFLPYVNQFTGVKGIVYLTADLYSDIEDKTVNGNFFKLILHSLSDLTKEITHNGETFVPIDWLEERYYTLGLYKECERLLEEDGHMW